MHPFQIIMIISATLLISAAALFFIIRSMPTKPGVSWWTGSCLFQSIAYVLSFAFFGADKNNIGDSVFVTLQMAGNQACALGLMLFLDAPVSVKYRAASFILALLVTYALIFNGHMFFALAVVGIYCAASVFQPAMLIFKQGIQVKHYRFTAVLLVLMGIHLLDYPFLRDVEWFAPIGFLIATLLAMGIFMSLIYMALMQFKEHTKASEQSAIQISITDPLTGLYNRNHLGSLFTDYSGRAIRSSGSFAMLYLDLDGFKAVNDSYGHQAGDRVLTVVASRLAQWAKGKGDVVRVGGDELIVLIRLKANAGTSDIRNRAQQLLDLIEKPITGEMRQYSISSSIGCCDYQSGISLDELIKCSDKLMYLAKQAGGRCIFIKNEVIDDAAEHRLRAKADAIPAMSQALL